MTLVVSTLPRVLEPEGMDTPEEVVAYDAMDHGAVNIRFVEDFLAAQPDVSRVIDLGTGTARIPLALWSLRSDARITAVDISEAMLAVAAKNVVAAGAASAITLALADAKHAGFTDESFTGVLSNSLVHHISDPISFFRDSARLVAEGGVLFVRDLIRPDGDAEVERLVALYATQDTPEQRALFEASLRAALSIAEVKMLVGSAGLVDAAVEATSDRHWTLTWRR